jgi:hypothetical protein
LDEPQSNLCIHLLVVIAISVHFVSTTVQQFDVIFIFVANISAPPLWREREREREREGGGGVIGVRKISHATTIS